MKIRPTSMLRLMFISGAAVDGAIAVSWFLIASGADIPNILNGYTGTGSDYRLAMYVGAMFMAGWTVLLAWGAIKPVQRRDLLLITSMLLFLSVIVDFVFYGDMLGGGGFFFGVTKRVLLSVVATAVYFYSFRNQENPRGT
jgi:hypothetical protein